MSEWQPIETAPKDGKFRLYGLHVRNRAGFEWFDVHYVALDDEGVYIGSTNHHIYALMT